jgi:hypothetical protein
MHDDDACYFATAKLALLTLEQQVKDLKERYSLNAACHTLSS